MAKLKMGIIGCGGMAKNHAANFAGTGDRIEVTALVDLDLERAAKVAAYFPGKPVVATDYRTVLDLVDAVMLVLPHHLHHPVGVACLNAGKHVLCEKPLANTEQECLEMIAAARQSRRVLMVAYCMRFDPLLLKFKECLDKKLLGECFQLSIWTEQHTEYAPGHWAHAAKTVGGGQLFSHGCHYIDLMLWIMGRPLWGSHIGTNLGTPWMEREGTSNVSIEFEGGKLGYHFGTWGARGSKLKYSFQAHCEKGLLEWERHARQIRAYTDGTVHIPGTDAGQKVTVIADEEKMVMKHTAAETAHFADCIERGLKPLTDPVSSLEGLRVIWKLYEAEDRHELADLRGLGLGTAVV